MTVSPRRRCFALAAVVYLLWAPKVVSAAAQAPEPQSRAQNGSAATSPGELESGTAAQTQETSAQGTSAGNASTEGSHTKQEKPAGWDLIHLNTQLFLHGRYDGDASAATFSIGRAYLTTQFTPAKWFEARTTFDAYQEPEGDLKVRLKYLYAKFKWPGAARFISDPYLEFGMVHTPWLDYEEHINLYRMQGTMFVERIGLFNSADLGATAGVLLGGRLDADYQRTVSKAYPGRFGSLAIGVYNGGGYHAEELNTNKALEGRLSLRPLGPLLPNLQLTGGAILARGNLEAAPVWRNYIGLASFEHRYFVLTGTIVSGVGNQKGTFVDSSGDPLEFFGYSLFGEARLRPIHSAVIGRYERYKPEEADLGSARAIVGYAFEFLPGNILLLDFEHVRLQDAEQTAGWTLTLTLKVEI